MDSEYDGKDEKMAERTQVKQKKALILLPYLKNGDGTAVALMNYYQELIEHGWRIDFLVLKIFECEWLNKVKADGNNIYELPKENKYSYKVSRKIRSIIKEGKYDIVHVNMPGHVGFETLKMARQYGILDEFSDLLLDMGETVSVFSRQAVWFRAIQLFVKSPVWGYGIRTNDGYRELINLSTGWGYFSHPHNYILYVLIQGGILELMLISYLIIKVTRMCLANRNNYMAKMLLVFYIASFVMGITESLVGYTLLFPIALYVGLLYEEEDYESISGRT